MKITCELSGHFIEEKQGLRVMNDPLHDSCVCIEIDGKIAEVSAVDLIKAVKHCSYLRDGFTE